MMLRDRVVCGVNNDSMQKRLLAETKLTFEDAHSVCNNCCKVGHIQRVCRSPKQGHLPKYQRKFHPLLGKPSKKLKC